MGTTNGGGRVDRRATDRRGAGAADPVHPDPIQPDTKDWTWVLDRACAECRFDPAAWDATSGPSGVGAVATQIRANADVWARTLTALSGTPQESLLTRRPDPATWSPLEYAGHVSDVHRIFAQRVALMLEDDDPAFANWDQDATANAEGYDRRDPGEEAVALSATAATVADAYDAVGPEQLTRTGRRSDGSIFTVATLATYHLHDVMHHLWDIRVAVTRAAYQARAGAYRDRAAEPAAHDHRLVGAFTDLLAQGARVLEIGSGGGRDALLLEAAGLSVRRTDVTPAFVDLLREAGHEADVLDPLVDDLRDARGSTYDGVWANACLLHVRREDLVVVLRRLAGAVRADGVLYLSLKEGDGEGWSVHGSITGPRGFVYWREEPLREVLAAAGWRVLRVDHDVSRREEHWLEVTARRTDPTP